MKRLFFALLLTACTTDPEPPPVSACRFAFTDTGDVRVFVVGHRHLVTDAESYASYQASYRRHMDAIAPCLSSSRPNLLVFPEDAGLVASLIGRRAADARAADASAVAFVTLLTALGDQRAHYAERFSGISPARQLTLVLSDVVWRAAEQTFGGIARDYGVWVLASANVGVVERSDDPELVALLGDPDVDAGEGVYVATRPEVYNSALLYEPGGAPPRRMNKVFLTSLEEDLLDLSNGRLDEPLYFDTPFARIGVAISRDAWYPPFMQRLEDVGADLIVQPEAFSGWTITQTEHEEWLPDVFLASGWLHTQKYRTFRHSLAPQLTGNFFDLVFDGQLHITQKARPGATSPSYVGQDALPGWVAVGPWVEDDPDPAMGVRARRMLLRVTGEALLPASGSPVENGYIDSLLAADVGGGGQPVAVAGDPTLPRSALIDDAPSGRQLAPDVAADGAGRLLLAWQDDRDGTPQIYWARSLDGGASWEPLGALAPSAAVQRKPSVCAGEAGGAAIAWQEGPDGAERVRLARFSDIAGAPSAHVAIADADAGVQWEVDCALLPTGELLSVWTSLDGGVPHLRYARATADTFDAAVRVDGSTQPLPRYRGSQLQPALSPAGDLVWIDYRDGSWDVYFARWEQTGFSAPARVDGVAGEAERLHGEPQVARSGDRVLVAFTDLHARRAHSDIAFVLSDDGGATWSAHRAVSGGSESDPGGLDGGTRLSRFRPALAPRPDGRFALAFQDLAPEKSAIFGAVVGDGASSPPAARLDDTADAPVSLTRPRLARAAAATVIVWEDDRQGRCRIATAVLGD